MNLLIHETKHSSKQGLKLCFFGHHDLCSLFSVQCKSDQEDGQGWWKMVRSGCQKNHCCVTAFCNFHCQCFPFFPDGHQFEMPHFVILFIACLLDWIVDWLIHCMADWLNDWFVACFHPFCIASLFCLLIDCVQMWKSSVASLILFQWFQCLDALLLCFAFCEFLQWGLFECLSPCVFLLIIFFLCQPFVFVLLANLQSCCCGDFSNVAGTVGIFAALHPVRRILVCPFLFATTHTGALGRRTFWSVKFGWR